MRHEPGSERWQMWVRRGQWEMNLGAAIWALGVEVCLLFPS